MSKKCLNEQIEVLKRTAHNASERAKAAEARAAELNRALLLLQRSGGAEDAETVRAIRLHLSSAEMASGAAMEVIAGVRERMRAMMEQCDVDAAMFGTIMHNVETGRAAIPGAAQVSDDELAEELATVVDENKRLKRALADAQAEVVSAAEAAAKDRVAIVTEKDATMSVLVADRAALKNSRLIISKVAKRLPQNWLDMGSSNSLAAALFQQAPNLAMVVLADLLDLFFFEFSRMQAEARELNLPETPPTESERVLEPVKVPSGDRLPCFTEAGQVEQLPPDPRCHICPSFDACHNENRLPAPPCHQTVDVTADSDGKAWPKPVLACELCVFADDCLNASTR